MNSTKERNTFAENSFEHPYVCFPLLFPLNFILDHVVAIVTQGRNSTSQPQWVTSYQLGFSQTVESWTLYKDADSVKVIKVMILMK